LFINGLGAITTAVVTIVISITKFRYGAWSVMLFVPVMVWLLVRLNRQYEREDRELTQGLEQFSAAPLRRPVTVILVDAIDRKTVHALQYAKTLRAEDISAVHLERDPMSTLELEAAWNAAGLTEIPLRVLRGSGEPASRLAGFVGGLPHDRDVNVLMPVPYEVTARERFSDTRAGARLTKALLPYDRVRVTLVRDHPGGVHPLGHDDRGGPIVRFAPRGTHSAVVLVDRLDRAVLNAVTFALSLGATDVRAVHAANDPDRAAALVAQWVDFHLPLRLDVIECWDRNIPKVLEDYVLELAGPSTEVTVAMPRRDFPKLYQRMLHDRTSHRISGALGRHPHVDIAAVPHYFADRPQASTGVVAAGHVK
jgi:hypothetical protein